jgi:hypothetical protein
VAKNKIDFTAPVDGKDQALSAVRPKADDLNKGDVARNAAFGRYMRQGVPLKSKLLEWARDQGVWDEAKAAELAKIDADLFADLSLLPDAAGRVAKPGLKASDLRDAAVRVRVNRNRRVRLLEPVNALDAQTAEGMSEEDKFRAVLVRCVLDAAGRPFFASVEDYLERADEPAAELAARHFATLYYGVEEDYQREFPENRFLLSRKMCDESLHLVDRQGKHCDVKGEPLPEDKPAEKDEAKFAVEDDWGVAETLATEAPAESAGPVAEAPATQPESPAEPAPTPESAPAE